MKKEPWGLIIYNRDKNLAAFTPQLFDDTEYNKKIVELKEQGYRFNCQSYIISKREDLEGDVEKNLGYNIVSLEEVFDIDLKE